MGEWLELLQVEYKKTKAPFDMNGASAFSLFFYLMSKSRNIIITINL